MAHKNNVYFRTGNLVVTVVRQPGRADGLIEDCPSDTCCLPMGGSRTCFFSMVMPRDPRLSASALATLLDDLRTKLDAEERGADVILRGGSPKRTADWERTLRREMGAPVRGIRSSVPRGRRKPRAS